MKRLILRFGGRALVLSGICTFLFFSSAADQVEMQNGDRYTGKVLSLNGDSVTLQNELLGKISLPRAKVSAILLGDQLPKAWAMTSSVTNALAKPQPVPSTNSLLASLNTNSALVKQVQRQFLSGADPEAQQKFNDLLSGLLSGRLSVEDIQREARSAADQARALKKELGAEAGFALDGYLAILDHFLKEAPASTPAVTNSTPLKAPTDSLEE